MFWSRKCILFGGLSVRLAEIKMRPSVKSRQVITSGLDKLTRLTVPEPRSTRRGCRRAQGYKFCSFDLSNRTEMCGRRCLDASWKQIVTVVQESFFKYSGVELLRTAEGLDIMSPSSSTCTQTPFNVPMKAGKQTKTNVFLVPLKTFEISLNCGRLPGECEVKVLFPV